MAYTLDQVKQLVSSGGLAKVTGSGTYGESQVNDYYDMLSSLKSAVQAGQLSVNDYFDIADPIVQRAGQVTQVIASQGKSAANAVNPGFQRILDAGFGVNQNGQWVSKAPFTAREYSSLPESVLPTQSDVNSGKIPLDLLPPVQRFRPDTTPATGSKPGSTVGGGSSPTPLIADPLQNSVPKTIDQSVIEQEGYRQTAQGQDLLNQQNNLSDQRMQSLRDLLTQQEDQQFNVDKHGIYEDLNSKGLLRSSGLGDALAAEKAKLAATTNNTLSQQGLSDTDRNIQSLAQILAQQQSFQTSGLERKFTLQDFDKESATAKALGSQYTPSIAGGKSVLSGVLGGATSGAAAGGSIGGPYGAGIGAVLGGTAGGASAKGK